MAERSWQDQLLLAHLKNGQDEETAYIPQAVLAGSRWQMLLTRVEYVTRLTGRCVGVCW